MKKNTSNLTNEQKAKLIAAYLLTKKEKSVKDKKEKSTPWKTLLGFRNV